MAFTDGDVARVTASMDISGVLVQGVFHVQAIGTSPATDAEALTDFAARIDSAYATLIALLTNEYDFNYINAFNVTEDAPMGEVGWPTLVTGSSIADNMPPHTAFTQLYPTHTARSQGRKFLGPFSTDARSDSGYPSAAVIAAGAAFGTALLAPWLFLGGQLVFGNWRDDTKPDGPLFSPWISWRNTSYFRTMRRRYPDAGP